MVLTHLARRPTPLVPKSAYRERQTHQQLSQESGPAHKWGPSLETLAEHCPTTWEEWVSLPDPVCLQEKGNKQKERA